MSNLISAYRDHVHPGHPAFKWAATVLCVWLLSGCGSLLESDQAAQSTWWLEPAMESANSSEKASSELDLVLDLTVVPGLDRDEVLTLSPQASLTPVAGAKWADHLPELLTSLTARSIAAADIYRSVNSGRHQPQDGCLLSVEVSEFWFRIDQQQQPQQAQFSIAGQLQCAGFDGPLTISETGETAVSDTRAGELTAAMQSSVEQVMRGLVASIRQP